MKDIYALDNPLRRTRVWKISKTGEVKLLASVDHTELAAEP